MSEQQGDYVTNAMEMLRQGYDAEQNITDASDLRKYRIELPNLYDDAGLDPYEFRLLAHYKRVGTCTESTKTTGTKCGMSPAQVSIKRKSLRDKGFIVLTEVPIRENEFSYSITVIDRWRENFEKYSTPLPRKRTPSGGERPLHVVKQRKNQSKKKPTEEVKAATPPEITLYREVTEKYPKKIAYEEVVKAVQRVTARLGRPCTKDDLLPYFKTWMTKSNNEYNFSVWLLDWAVAGKITNGANYANSNRINNTPARSAPADDENARATAERIRARRALANV